MTRPPPAPVKAQGLVALDEPRPIRWLVLGLLALLGLALVPALTAPAGLGQLRYPGESAGRLTDRHWYFYEGYATTGRLERSWHRLLFGAPEQVKAQNIESLREVLRYFAANPQEATSWAALNVRARLLVSLAESGRDADLAAALSALGPTPEEDTLGAALRYAYHLPGGTAASRGEIIAGLNFMPLGWSADRLALRIAERDGHSRRVSGLRDRLEREGAKLRQRTGALGLATGLLMGLGGLALASGVLRGRAPAATGPDWAIHDGLKVMLWSVLAAVVIGIALQWLPGSYFRPGPAAAWSVLFAGIPMLWLIHRRLLRPRGTGLIRAFGLRGQRAPVRLLGAGLGLFALDRGGAMALAWLGGLWNGQAHWAQGIYEPLVFGPEQTVWLVAAALVLWTPLIEEIGFRGLLYRTLAQRWAPGTAALLGALAFAALHGQSTLVFASLVWTGLVLTWGYQRSASLWPCIIAHALSNAVTLAIVVAFYR